MVYQQMSVIKIVPRLIYLCCQTFGTPNNPSCSFGCLQGVVVVKYVFRFSFLPWNDKAITSWDDWRLLLGVRDDDPFACSGEQPDELCAKDGKINEEYYATYELLILLSVFIHRSVLKVGTPAHMQQFLPTTYVSLFFLKNVKKVFGHSLPVDLTMTL